MTKRNTFIGMMAMAILFGSGFEVNAQTKKAAASVKEVAIPVRVAAFVQGSHLIGNPAKAGVNFSYQLKQDAFVTIVIEKQDGTRVRNLISCAQRKAGKNTEHWDGLDDTGTPCVKGEYRWRGIEHDDIGSYFQTAFNSPGNPPWKSQEVFSNVGSSHGLKEVLDRTWGLRPAGSGGWLSDHGNPLCVYASGDKIFIGSNIAEAGHSLMELDLNGVKKWGTLWFSAACANAVAIDDGIIYVAGEKGWIPNKLKVHRLSTNTYRFIKNPKDAKRTDAAFIAETSENFSGIRGIIITPDYVVLSLSDKGRLALFDKKTAAFVKDIPLPKAGGITKNKDGAIFAIEGKRVVKVNLKSGRTSTVISSELLTPDQLCVDAKGNFYVSDSAPSEQCVKVFSPTGKFLRNIGEKGGHKEGKFNPKVMGSPAGIAIDSQGKLWVAENDHTPKRISVWSKEGALLKDFIGPPEYGGGGSLDPENANVAFYEGMIFDLKPWPKKTTLRTVGFLPEDHKDLPINAKKIPSHALRYGDGLFLVSAAGYATPPAIYEMKDDHLIPRAVMGSVRGLKKNWKDTQKQFVDKLIAEKVADNVPFLWSDIDGNGKAVPAEITLLKGTVWRKPIWNCLIGKKLELQAVISKNKKQTIIRIPPKMKSGILVYDIKDAIETPVTREIGALSSDPQGNYIINYGGGMHQADKTNMLASLKEDGSTRWTYPNPYPTNSHNSPRPTVGNIQHTLNIEGFAKVKGFDAQVFQLNGNKGVRYLFTDDGLFVCQLFGDMRTALPLSTALKANVGLRLDKYSLTDECFAGWLGNAPDGRILQVLGKDSSNVLEVKGLETLKRISGGNVTLNKVSKITDIANVKKPVKVIFNPTGVKPADLRYKFPTEEPLANFCLVSTEKALAVRMQVDGNFSFVNAGQDFKTLFKHGACIDIRLASNPKLPKNRTKPGVGDMRVVVANLNGKPTAVLYKFVVPGTKESSKSKYSSPAGSASVDEIKIIKPRRLQIKKTQKGYSAIITIPWKELGFDKLPTGKLYGDVGILVPDAGGTRTVARYYYYDQKSQVVSDLPSEIMVDPSQWGILEF